MSKKTGFGSFVSLVYYWIFPLNADFWVVARIVWLISKEREVEQDGYVMHRLSLVCCGAFKVRVSPAFKDDRSLVRLNPLVREQCVKFPYQHGNKVPTNVLLGDCETWEPFFLEKYGSVEGFLE